MIAENIEEEVQFVINWYIGNLAYANENIEVWSEGYDPLSHVDISTVTSIYNYLLGIDATFYERLDLNQDGIINTTDVTIAYNVLLEQ